MLSRVLTEAAAEAQPLTWRRSQAIPTKPAQDSTSLPPDEAAQLRLRLAELAAAAEQQARQAYEAGVRAGDAAARNALEADTRATVERLVGAIVDVAGTRSGTIQRAEADTVRLAIEIARRVLHRELCVDPNALQALTCAALEKLQSQEIYRVRVHPALEPLVRACLQQGGRAQGIEVIADPSQPQGGLLFDISRGTLDASVNTQLDEIARGLTDQLETRQ
jgi:flagellar assembly protein FliH